MFTKRSVVLKEDETKVLLFYPLTESEFIRFKQDIENTTPDMYGINKFKDKYDIDPRHILMYGDTKIDENTAKNIIESTFIEDLINKQKVPNYKCFCASSLLKPTVVIHKTAKSAWACMLVKLNNPTHGVIITKDRTSQEDTTKTVK